MIVRNIKHKKQINNNFFRTFFLSNLITSYMLNYVFFFPLLRNKMATNFNRIFSFTALSLLLLIMTIQLTYSCNEQVCASIVSKCMLTQSCKCDSQNYSCCVECFKCLGHLKLECCSCLGKFFFNQLETFLSCESIKIFL